MTAALLPKPAPLGIMCQSRSSIAQRLSPPPLPATKHQGRTSCVLRYTTLHNNRGQTCFRFRTLKGGSPPILEALSNPALLAAEWTRHLPLLHPFWGHCGLLVDLLGLWVHPVVEAHAGPVGGWTLRKPATTAQGRCPAHLGTRLLDQCGRHCIYPPGSPGVPAHHEIFK